ncbi:MAG TPA: ISAs1 family transposase [Anaerolineales bacterium]|jgi:predicted transposase YbfD/YdcC|nr:ISAs1 family transposase [Anaerolineales bacterium]
MHCSTARIERAISANGIEFDQGSIYDQLCKLTDLRSANGKRYRLETVLMIVIMAKLCGEDTPFGIAEWAKHRQEELVKLLCLNRPSMPSHHTYRRILAYKVYAEEVERLVGEYNQQGERGKVYALDGKAVRGMRKKDEEGNEYLLSVYDVEQAKVMAQVEVGRKENEISKAPKALKMVEISQKVITGDAMHTQRGLAAQIIAAQGDYVLPVKENQPHLYKNIQSLFAPEYPKPGFGKIQTDFLMAQKVNKGHGRIETRTITTSEMLNSYAAWPGLAQVYRLERQFQWWRHGRCYRTSREVEFGITSLMRKQASPSQVLNFRQAHWGIETGLHYRRDFTMKEDATRMTTGIMGKVMASINNLVLALIRQAKFHNAAQARRWFAAHTSEAFLLLTLPFSRF